MDATLVLITTSLLHSSVIWEGNMARFSHFWQTPTLRLWSFIEVTYQSAKPTSLSGGTSEELISRETDEMFNA